MTKKFTLDDIRDAAEAKYGSTWVVTDEQEIELVNLLRLPKEKRDVILSLSKKAEKPSKGEGEESEESVDIDEMRDDLKAGLTAACRTTEQANALMAFVGDDTALVMQVFTMYTKETQAGEASPSQD